MSRLGVVTFMGLKGLVAWHPAQVILGAVYQRLPIGKVTKALQPEGNKGCCHVNSASVVGVPTSA